MSPSSNVVAVALSDAAYPPLLKQIFDPPPTLFVRGNLAALAGPALAVVGTRQATAYGRLAVEKLVPPLTRAGLTIVSGLAYGIDQLAHSATLTAGGTTVAVLAGGVDRTSVQPSRHQYLAEQIIDKGGAVVSEYPPGTPAVKFHFPKRNRIVAGLSLGTLVIEAGEKSGALITAAASIEAGREVFAVPHTILSPTGIGANRLLQHGAKLVTTVQDILEFLPGFSFTKNKTTALFSTPAPASAAAAALLTIIPTDGLPINEIITRSQRTAAQVISLISGLEMSGHVRDLGGLRFARL